MSELAATIYKEVLPVLIAATSGFIELSKGLGQVYSNPVVQAFLKGGLAGLTAGGSLGAEAALRKAQEQGRAAARGAKPQSTHP